MPRTGTSFPISIGWIASLARPYLRGYRVRAERGDQLRGYWFLVPPPGGSRARRSVASVPSPALGFFVGYLLAPDEYGFLAAEPPASLVFAFVEPLGGSLHGKLVGHPESLVRKTAEYIRWLTHRPPRFAFYPGELPALVRHHSMREWPPAKYEHYSRNFFIETLALLVRSGLVRRLLTESPPASKTNARRPRKGTRSR
ncbi:MAG TPA: hypothetical protein VKE24_07685 [Candidatus Acidoferrales bacterium]|nr:hypothetical protein [Candidatus Acidoferrales bacterium]